MAPSSSLLLRALMTAAVLYIGAGVVASSGRRPSPWRPGTGAPLARPAAPAVGAPRSLLAAAPGPDAAGADAAAGPAAVPSPAPEVQQEAAPAEIFYAAVFLNDTASAALLDAVPPIWETISADHMTIAFQPSLEDCLAMPLGQEATLSVLGQAADNRTQGLAVEHPSWVPFLTESVPHVTVSVADGVPAKDTGDMIRAALATPGALEPLANLTELTGAVGVQLTDGRRVYSADELLAALGEAGQAAPAPAPEAAT